MKEFRVLVAALCMLLLSLTVSGVRNVSATPESSTYDIYEESERLVALTFDDGPKEGKTDALLDMLKEKGDMVLPVDFKVCDEEAMKVQTKDGYITEISKEIPCESGEGEFIGIAKISKNILPDLKLSVKKMMEEKQFGSYFEGAIQDLIGIGKYDFKVLSTKERFWGEIDFEEDYKRALAEIPKELVMLAGREFGRI